MTTPMMQQWHACKKQAKNAVLLFRLGDFYEAFYDDAETLAKELELTLTKRQNVPMSGVPYHSVEKYIDRLIEKGFVVAIAEQTEDPKQVKGIVKREITSFVSAATTFGDTILQEKGARLFACCAIHGKTYGLSLIDITTGEFFAAQCLSLEELLQQLQRFDPKEILLPQTLHTKCREEMPKTALIVKENWLFNIESCFEALRSHFGLSTLDGLGFAGKNAALCAAGVAFIYLRDERAQRLEHLQKLEKLYLSQHLDIDHATARQLEIFTSFFDYLNQTTTPMGSRKLRRMLAAPLQTKDDIQSRQQTVQQLRQSAHILQKKLQNIRDIERLLVRIARGSHGPRDLGALNRSLLAIPDVKKILQELGLDHLQLEPFDKLTTELSRALSDTLPFRLSDGNTIKKDYCSELDHIRALKDNSNNWLKNYEQQLRTRTGCRTLKVGDNKAFGYFIEVSRRDGNLMPPIFHKKQTLTSSERFISPELKAFEQKMFNANQHIAKLEKQCFDTLTQHILESATQIRHTARTIAEVDALNALAILSNSDGYVLPEITEDRHLAIVEGRHPLVETSLGRNFIPNSIEIGQKTLMILTGPNMGGKSTYIKQTALIVILAHLGAYIPAKEAKIGLVDRIFSRIGANDDLMAGKSTFMVEMTETANILHNTTDRSLVILDEIGRGTSTYDGISIAWAVAAELARKNVLTLFATHYFELIDLADEFTNIMNCHVTANEKNGTITFLHQIQEGAADKSYGIHVAALAGIPSHVVQTAQEKLKTFGKPSIQWDLFERKAEPQWINQLKTLNVEKMTPLEALIALEKIHQEVKNS